MSVKDLINAIASGSAIHTEQAFNQVMAEKISARLDDMRIEVAQNMFNEAASDDRALLHKHEKQAGIGSFPNQVHSAHKSGNKIHVAWHDEDEGTHHVSVFHIGKNGHGGDYSGAPSSSHKTKQQAMAAAKKAASLKEELTLEDYSIEELEEYMMSEDYEQLDEISKGTMGRYLAKAGADIANREAKKTELRKKSDEIWQNTSSLGNRDLPRDVSDKLSDVGHQARKSLEKQVDTHSEKQWKRQKGIQKAINKLSK